MPTEEAPCADRVGIGALMVSSISDVRSRGNCLEACSPALDGRDGASGSSPYAEVTRFRDEARHEAHNEAATRLSPQTRVGR